VSECTPSLPCRVIAKDLPKKIAPKLVGWRKGQHTRAAVKVAIKDALDSLPQTLFDDAAFLIQP
jgi:hypothetical protein